MVDTWRCPNESYSVFSISSAETPSCAGVLPVDVHRDLRILDQQIAGHVGQLGKLPQPGLERARRPVQGGDVAALERVLVQALGGEPADRDGRRVLDVDRDARHRLYRGGQIARRSGPRSGGAG